MATAGESVVFCTDLRCFFVSFSWNVDLCSDPLVPRIEKQKVETGAIENRGRKDTTGPSNVAPLSTTHVNCIGAVAAAVNYFVIF